MSMSHIASRLLVLLAILGLSVTGLFAQKISVNAPDQVRQDSQFNVVYVIESTSGRLPSINSTHITDPTVSGAEVLYGPSLAVSNSVQSVNGRTTQSSQIAITYRLLATTSGRISISGFSIKAGDTQLSASSSNIRVLPASSAGSSAQAREMFSFETIVSRRSVYEQEPLIVTYQVRGTKAYELDRLSLPAHSDFVSNNLLSDGRVPVSYERIRGVDYAVADVGREVLFPQKSGTVSISGASATIKYVQEDESDSFMRDIRQRQLQTSPVAIEVKPLPTEGRPDNFSGAVGQFAMSQSLSTKEWRTNEAVLLRVTIRGAGNLRLAKSPQLQLPEGIDLYDPIENTEYSYESGRYEAVRTIEYSLIPRQTGKVSIEPLRFAYFDPSSSQYREVSTSPISINVVQGKALADDNASALRHETVASEDQPYGLLEEDTAGAYTPMSWGYILIHLMLLLAGWGVYRYLVHRNAQRADVVSFGAQRAGRVATKRLRTARKHLDASATEALYEELLHALWGYLGDKLRMKTSSLTRVNVSEALRQRTMSEDLISELIATIDAIEFARFAPTATEISPSELYERTAKVITSIENSKLLG